MGNNTPAEHPPLVIVVWDDAKADTLKQVTLEDVHLWHMPTVMQTLGWLLKDDEKGVTIANERCLDVGDDGYRGPTFIPRVLVKSVTPFNLTTKRKPRHAKNPVQPVSSPSDPLPGSSK